MERQTEGQPGIPPELTKMEQLLRACRGADGMVDPSLIKTLPWRGAEGYKHNLKKRIEHLEKYQEESVVHLCSSARLFNLLVRSGINTLSRLESLIKDDLLITIKPTVPVYHVRGINLKETARIAALWQEWHDIRTNYFLRS